MISRIPPTILVLIAIVAIQFGAAIATQLFATLGAHGTVAIRVIISAILMVAISRTSFSKLQQTLKTDWQLLIPYGFCMAAMNLFFYMAIARIPLGAAVAFEFIGPLSVAALTSRQGSHFAWVALAAIGIFLLSPFTGTNLDTLGIVFALLAGAGWALFIILSRQVGDRIPGNSGLVLGMTIAAAVLTPLAVPVLPQLFSNPLILSMAFGVAVLSTTLPFTLEFEALKKLPARTYGILVSLEPAAAAAIGALLLGERLGIQGIVAVLCVVTAAIGITLADKS